MNRLLGLVDLWIVEFTLRAVVRQIFNIFDLDL